MVLIYLKRHSMITCTAVEQTGKRIIAYVKVLSSIPVNKLSKNVKNLFGAVAPVQLHSIFHVGIRVAM